MFEQADRADSKLGAIDEKVENLETQRVADSSDAAAVHAVLQMRLMRAGADSSAAISTTAAGVSSAECVDKLALV